MPTLHVAFFRAKVVADGGADFVLPPSAPIVAEALTTSGTSAATTATAGTASANGTLVARCSATDAAHYVVAGAAPTASATNGYWVPSGGVIDISVAPGDKIAARTV